MLEWGKIELRKLGLNYIGHTYNDVYFFILPMLLPILRSEFGLSYTQVGLLLTCHVAIRSLCTFISGNLGAKYDRHIIIAIGFILSSIVLGSFILVEGINSIVTLLILLAIGVSTFHPLATTMVGEEASTGKRMLQLGIFESGGAIGIILVTFIFGFMVEKIGWQKTCFFIALPGFFIALGFLKFKKLKITSELEGTKEVDIRYIFLVLFARGISFCCVWAILSYSAIYATDILHLHLIYSSWYLTFIFVGYIIGSIGTGYLGDQINPLKVILLTNLLMIPLVFGVSYILNPLISGFLFMLFGVFFGGLIVSQNFWLITVSNSSNRSKVFGAGFFLEGVSATLAPYLYGWLADQIGLLSIFRWATLPLVIALAFYSFIFYLNHQKILYKGIQAIDN